MWTFVYISENYSAGLNHKTRRSCSRLEQGLRSPLNLRYTIHSKYVEVEQQHTQTYTSKVENVHAYT